MQLISRGNCDPKS